MRFARLRRQGLALGLAVMAIFSGAPRASAQDRAQIEIVPQIGHSLTVKSIAFSPDGARVLSGSEDNTLKLWDVATGMLLRTLEAGTNVLSVTFSRDGAHVLSGSADKTLKLWDAATGELLRTFEGHTDRVNSVAFSPDGALVLSGSDDKTVRLWDATNGALLRTFDSDWVRSVAFSPDGARVLSAYDKLKLWDTASGALLRTIETDIVSITSVSFSPDGARVLSGGWDKTLRLWDAATGELLRTFEGHTYSVNSVAFSPDGARVLSGSADRTLKLWDAATGELLRTFEGHTYSVNSIAFSPDGARILSASGDRLASRTDNTIKLWDATTGAQIRSFEALGEWVWSVALSPDGALVLSGGWDKTLRLWDATTGALLRTMMGHLDAVTSAAFLPDGALVVSGSHDNTAKLWDATTGALLRTFEGHSGPVNSIAISPDGARLLSGSGDRTIKLWDLAGALLRTFNGHSKWVGSVAFSPDGALVVSGSDDKTVRLWDATTGRLLRTFEGHSDWVRSVAFSPDGTHVLSGSLDNTVKLWDATSGALLRTFEGRWGAVRSVAFSPDGAGVLSGAANTPQLWDRVAGRLVHDFKGHLGRVRSVAFSPDSSRAVSGGEDGTIRVWDTATGQHIVTLLNTSQGDWLAITREGFFAASTKGSSSLSIVSGLEATRIDQVHQSLFNPDLVREALAGDANGEVQGAAKVISLEKVLDSGPAPSIAITSPTGGSQSARDLVTVTARIEDRGKGIGRIEWRVNGITAAIAAKPPGGGPTYTVTQELALDTGGDNTVEVVAYNGSNLLASLSARTTIKFTSPPDQTRPKLHILAIGINAYVDKGWAPPGSARLAFAPLGLAVKDATAFGTAMRKAAAGLYGEVRITLALDKDATRDKLEKTVAKITAEVHPRDSFILFAAGHGTSENGRFYLIPQDYQSGPGHLPQRAIGQDRLQDWLANRIKARRAIILLDTCESGALVAGHARSRADAPASEAAVGRLHEATGRPVLTAAAAGQFAHEGLVGASGERHGVFTWALLDALRKGDSNGNGLIELSELVRHVQSVVPKIAGEMGGAGRAATAEPVFGKQAARFGSRGEDFAVAQRMN